MPTFRAVIQEARGGGGAWVEVPPAVVLELGGGGRIPVYASFDGIPYRGSVVSMGGPVRVIGILKGIRTQLKKGFGDEVEVILELDSAEREVDVPEDLTAALKNAGVADAFAALSFTDRREIAAGVTGAKKPETRKRRIESTIERLKQRD